MPFEREPIFHDRQFVADQTTQTTTSLVFVDITGATLTTKDLGQEGNYETIFTLVIQATQANTLASFRILVNGNPISPMARTLLIKTNNADLGVTFAAFAEDLVVGDVLQVQWKTDKGTITLSEFTLLIDGIPEIRIV